jgi:hypothetical protein
MYEALPAAAKALIADRKAEHPYSNSGKQVKGWQGTRIDVMQRSMARHLPDGRKASAFRPYPERPHAGAGTARPGLEACGAVADKAHMVVVLPSLGDGATCRTFKCHLSVMPK